MAIPLKTLMAIASGELTLAEGLQTMGLPALLETGNKTFIMKATLKEGAKKDSKKSSDYVAVIEYWKESFDEKMDSIKQALDRSETEKKELSLWADALAMEHQELIDKYNKLVKK